MEILALLAVGVAWAIGWIVCVACLSRHVPPAERFFFAPAFGLAVCAVIGYVAVQLRVPWVVTAFAAASLLSGAYITSRRWAELAAQPFADRLARFTGIVVLLLFAAQLVVSELFSQVYPAPTPVWQLFKLTGVPPPDQLFAWSQAMFLDQHRVYPRDPFYADMDLYDRPHLGGWITLFFFKLFHLPLTEYPSPHAALVDYPAGALRFYHCFWWLLNNFYLLGVAVLFRRLFGQRAAIFAVASTAVGSFFFLCNAGAWMKFSSAYFLLLSLALFAAGKAPVLQALLCAASYYIHGSVLPYLAGLGMLHFISLRYPLPRILPLRDFLLFSTVGVLVVGAWFLVVRWSGSKQPLLYYYLYDAGLTAAQTRPVHELAREFYERYTWSTLSLRPANRIMDSLLPVTFHSFFQGWLSSKTPGRFSDLVSAVFSMQRFWLPAALGVAAVPVVLAGCARSFALKHAGKIAFCLYLAPTLIIALVYGTRWPFSLHITMPFHTLVLFMWVAVLRRVPVWSVAALGALAAEGVLCVLLADGRFLPVSGIRLNALSSENWLWLAAYLVLIAFVLALTVWELRWSPFDGNDGLVPPLPAISVSTVLAFISKVAAGIIIVAAVLALHALYLRRFY